MFAIETKPAGHVEVMIEIDDHPHHARKCLMSVIPSKGDEIVFKGCGTREVTKVQWHFRCKADGSDGREATVLIKTKPVQHSE